MKRAIVAYTAFTQVVRHRYTYFMRTIPGISDLLKPLENVIRLKLIPAITEGRLCSDDDRTLLSLPVRLGGMGIIIPTQISDEEFENSNKMTHYLTEAIQHQVRDIPDDLDNLSRVCKLQLRSERRAKQLEVLEDLTSRMTAEQKQVNDISRESGSSNWLTCLPLEDSGYVLTKQEFWDAVNLRYNWPLTRMPSNCVCGAKFDLTHAFTCKKGGFVSNRHDAIRNITTNLLNEVCKDVCVEPALTALSGESIIPKSANTSAEARLDISARGVWTTGQRAFFDVRVLTHSLEGTVVSLSLKLTKPMKVKRSDITMTT